MVKTGEKKKRVKAALIILSGILLAALIGGVLFFSQSTLIAGRIISRDADTVDTEGRRISSVLGLLMLRDPQELQLCGSALSAKQGGQLLRKYPDCAISWDVPLSSGAYPNSSESLTLDTLTASDVPLLALFPALREVDASACGDEGALDELAAAYPELTLRRSVRLAGSLHPCDAEVLSLDPAAVDPAELMEKLPLFPQLRTVELRGADLPVPDMLTLTAAFPDTVFLWSAELAPGHSFDTDAESIDLSGCEGLSLDTLRERLPLFRSLMLLDLTGCGFSDDELVALRQECGGLPIRWETEVCGVRVPTDIEELDISGMTVRSAEEIEAVLPRFFRLSRVIMCECGISDEEMDALDLRHEDIRFIWTVHFGAFFLRTDATSFIATTFPYGYTYLSNAQAAKIGYCRDLVALDIGHMHYTDVSFVSRLPKLRYLIIVESGVSDISWVQDLPELYYFELFLCPVADLSPLSECKNLRHLNLSYTYAQNFEVLAGMPWLERLWLTGAGLPRGTRELLRESLPNTKLEMSTDGSSTGGSWRTDPAYFEMRDIFGAYYMKG